MLNLKQSIQANIPGWNGHLIAHVMGWFGEGNPVKVHRVNRYLSNSPAVVAAQLDAMRSIGIEGVMVTWQGPTVNPFLHAATIALWEGCMERQMLFGLVLDPWIAEGQANPTQAAIAALQSSDCQEMLNSPAYLPEGYIIDFNLAAAAGVTIAALQAAVPSNPILSWHSGFSWPNIPVNPQVPADSLAALKADNANPAMKIAGVNVVFDDGGQPLPTGVIASLFKGLRNYALSVWPGTTPTRAIDHQAGNWFFDQLAVTPATVPYIALVTWNDSDEGSGIEHVIAALSGVRIGK
jgi:hypothetical protein